MIFKPYFGNYEIMSLFRVGGPGLGNLLFPLSRAHIYTLKYNGTLLPPIWPSVKIGAFMRAEREKRGYTNIFKSKASERIVKEFQYLFSKRISEDEFLVNSSTLMSQTNLTIKVEGLKNYFVDLKGYEEEILKYLLSISSEHIIHLYNTFNQQNIGVHVRLGDYSQEARTPISWYINTIKKLQQLSHGKILNFTIFSDGTDDELRDLLNLPNCERISNSNAWGDILRLSKCKIVIGSNSTFSGWSAFLGKKSFIREDKFYMGRLFEGKDNIYEGNLLTEVVAPINLF